MIEAEPNSYLFIEFHGTTTAVRHIEIKVREHESIIPLLIIEHIAKAIKEGLKGIEFEGRTYNQWKIKAITYGTKQIPEDIKQFLRRLKER